jgi:hypothetical protein
MSLPPPDASGGGKLFMGAYTTSCIVVISDLEAYDTLRLEQSENGLLPRPWESLKPQIGALPRTFVLQTTVGGVVRLPRQR